MNIPNLPTDNLYKFIALSGVLLIITSLATMWLHADKSQEVYRELVKINVLLNSDLKNVNKDKTIDLAEGKKLLEELDSILNDKPIVLTYGVIFMLIGSILSITGFTLWYQRVQKYQDILLKHRAAQASNKSSDNAAT